MLPEFAGQSAAGSLDELFKQTPVLSHWLINGYPLLSLVFNLLLLAVPAAALWCLERLPRRGWWSKPALILLMAVWLVFMPNTAYIITDARHLVVPDCRMSDYYRVCASATWPIFFFFTYALVGWLFFVWLVRRLQAWWSSRYGYLSARWLVALVIPLIGLGVLLGLVERWNSWQLLTSPLAIGRTALAYLTDGTRLINWLAATACLYVLYYGGTAILAKRAIKRRRR